MHALISHSRHLLLALTVLALSAGLAFGSTPPAAGPGLATAAANSGKTVPVAGGDETTGEDEDAGEDEDTDEDEDAGEDEETEDGDTDEDAETDEDVESEEAGAGGEHCATDPSALTPEDLALMNHGSIACWAAHQTEWPAWFSNHGAFVRCWAHQGKADAASCTEDPTLVEGTEVEPAAATTTNGHGKGHGKAKGKAKHGA
jgi:hypothetical protein